MEIRLSKEIPTISKSVSNPSSFEKHEKGELSPDKIGEDEEDEQQVLFMGKRGFAVMARSRLKDAWTRDLVSLDTELFLLLSFQQSLMFNLLLMLGSASQSLIFCIDFIFAV
jgi:hypothetical protein